MSPKKDTIGYEHVAKAAILMLIEGDRPTVRGVRDKIGRGSPNVILPLLSDWFTALGAHLATDGLFAKSVQKVAPKRRKVPVSVWELGSFVDTEAVHYESSGYDCFEFRT